MPRAKRVAKIANTPMPQMPLQRSDAVPHNYVEHLVNHSVAQALGYGMIPRDTAGIQMILNSAGRA